MSTTVTPKPGGQLWGIYHTDREHARELGDPLRTTIEAPTKLAAEEAAAKLGFSDPWAHPIAPEVVRLTRFVLKNIRDTGSNSHTTHQRRSCLIMQTPTTAQLRTAIEVLNKLSERLNIHAEHFVMQLAESPLGTHYAGRIEVGTIEQTTRIESVATQLKNWRGELLEQRRQCVSHHV